MDKLLQQLGHYKHIQFRVELYWGTREFRPYIQELLTPKRSNRKGFPLCDLQTILDLLELHDETFPQFKPKFDPWANY